MTGRTLAIIAAVVAGLMTLWLWPKPKLSAEGEIRGMIARCVRAAEDKELSVIVDSMADDFRGPSSASREDVKGLIAFQVLRNKESVAVFNPTLSVTVTAPDSGEVSGKFVFARAKAKSFDELPQGAVVSAYEIGGTVRLRDDKWQFVTATYKQLTE